MTFGGGLGLGLGERPARGFAAVAAVLTNPGFETGDLTGWTTLTGSPQVRINGTDPENDAQAGSYYLSSLSSPTLHEIYQDLTIPAGATLFSASAWIASQDAINDGGAVRCSYRDASTEVGTATSGNQIPTPAGSWEQHGFTDDPIPSGAITCRLIIRTFNNSGGGTQGCADSVAASFA